MLKIDTIYKSSLTSVLFIESQYNTEYKTIDFNKTPSISFPIKSGYGYSSDNFEGIVDTNSILFETKNNEFTLTKFSEFQHDITLSFTLPESGFELLNSCNQKGMTAETYNRSPQTEYLIQLFLKSYPSEAKLLIDQIVSELFTELHNLPSRIIKINTIQPWINKKTDDAKEYIHAFYTENVSINDISASCNISPFHFSRVFKIKTGYTPYDYLMKVRMAKAKQLLKKDTSITAIAFDVGFNSVENFSYSFRKINGLSPTQFKKQQYF